MNDLSRFPKFYYICRICGLDTSRFSQKEPPWDPDGCSSYGTCPCCGVEFGYQDSRSEGIKKYREDWLKNGAQWRDPPKKPKNWSLEEQMKNIPEEFL